MAFTDWLKKFEKNAKKDYLICFNALDLFFDAIFRQPIRRLLSWNRCIFGRARAHKDETLTLIGRAGWPSVRVNVRFENHSVELRLRSE